MLHLGAITVVLALFADVSLMTLPEITAYRDAIAQLASGTSNGSVAAAFSAARAVRERLLKNQGNDSLIEQLSDQDFKQLSTLLSGIILNREEVLLAEPDPRFFLELARRRGAPVDVAFFENYSATFPDGVWPAYLEQQTDATGCTDFGSGELVRRYAGWRHFKSEHPDAYTATVAELLAQLEENLVESTCACGNRTSVVAELRAFLRRFPHATVAPRVRKRLNALRSSDSGIRFRCTSG